MYESLKHDIHILTFDLLILFVSGTPSTPDTLRRKIEVLLLS